MNDANINGICDELEVLGCTCGGMQLQHGRQRARRTVRLQRPHWMSGTSVVQGCTVPEAGNYDLFSNECRADLDDDGLIGMGDLLLAVRSSCE